MLLALDSASRQAGLALYDGDTVRGEVIWHSSAHHTQWMATAIEDALRRTNCTAAELAAVAVSTGPGSFTGLRVALSLAKGIAAAQSLPIVGISTLDVTAYPYVEGGHAVCATLQAGRGRHAYAFYGGGTTRASMRSTAPSIGTVSEIAVASAEHAQEGLVWMIGEFTPAERQFLMDEAGAHVQVASPALVARRPAVLAEMAWQRLEAGEVDDLHTLEPVYLNLTNPDRP
jgi:tRNA threonylcarbamoyladenosine biosynthesis protein TsaB